MICLSNLTVHFLRAVKFICPAQIVAARPAKRRWEFRGPIRSSGVFCFALTGPARAASQPQSSDAGVRSAGGDDGRLGRAGGSQAAERCKIVPHLRLGHRKPAAQLACVERGDSLVAPHKRGGCPKHGDTTRVLARKRLSTATSRVSRFIHTREAIGSLSKCQASHMKCPVAISPSLPRLSCELQSLRAACLAAFSGPAHAGSADAWGPVGLGKRAANIVTMRHNAQTRTRRAPHFLWRSAQDPLVAP